MAANNFPGMEKWRGKVALITGASAGIGYDLAKQLAELGMNVVGCARNIEKIQQLSGEVKAAGGGEIVAVKCDVTKEEDVKAVYEVAKTKFGGVDVCINNAGVAHNAPLLSGATDDWRNMLEVNVLGLCICTREFTTQLKERGVNEGHIFLLNSMSGHRIITTPINTFFYASTKYAVTALTEGIRRELREMKSNVRVTSISPGMVTTEFHARVRNDPNVAKIQEDLRTKGGSLEAEDVSSAVIYALSCPPQIQIHDVLMRSTHQVS